MARVRAKTIERVAIVVAAAWAFAWTVVTKSMGVGAVVRIVAIVLPTFVAVRLGLLIWTGARMRSALVAENAPAFREALEDLRYLQAVAPAQLASHEAIAFGIEDRWAEAVKVLEAIDDARLPVLSRSMHRNNLAWMLAHAGEPERAVEMARRVIASLPPLVTKRSRGAFVGTLGVAQHLAGRHGEAVATLREAIAIGGDVRMQSTRLYFLGEASRALGNDEDAKLAWEAARAASPAGKWGRRAAMRLQTMHVPFR